MSTDLALFEVASDGSVEQWDGVAPRQGIMPRWLQRGGPVFPDYGYDLYRAVAPDYFPLLWDQLAGAQQATHPREQEWGPNEQLRTAAR